MLAPYNRATGAQMISNIFTYNQYNHKLLYIIHSHMADYEYNTIQSNCTDT